MLERILRFSIDHRGFVVLAAVAIAMLGLNALLGLPIDAVPDVTNRQVVINTADPSLSPTEMERQVTFVIETELAGVPGLDSTRSFARNGFSQVTAVFRDDVDLYFARQQVAERLSALREQLPASAEVRLGPITTGLGEVYMWTVEFGHPEGAGAESGAGRPGWQPDGAYQTPEGERLGSALERAAYLRTVQEWIIRPQIQAVRGVAGVDAIGGYRKQYHVEPDPMQLAAHGLTLSGLVAALERNNLATGAGYLERRGEAYVVRADDRVSGVEELREIVVAVREGLPVRVGDVARVGVGREIRTGSASENGHEVVVATAFMLIGENSRTVARAVGERLEAVNRSLPPDIRAKTVLDRSALVDATIRTVERNLVEGALLVIVVLLALLGHLRAALITALAIPLSMLIAAIGMREAGVSGNLMSLGAIDFGLIVDGSVIVVENCLRQLRERRRALGRELALGERLETVRGASSQVLGAAGTGGLIIIVVYVPILFLTGVEGRMFRPMALTVIFALTGAFALAFTLVPALVAIFVRASGDDRSERVVEPLRSAYGRLLGSALRHRALVLGVAGLVMLGGLGLFTRIGQVFAPALSELDVLVQPVRIPSVGLEEATRLQLEVERRLAEVPEVAFVFSRTGTAEMAVDPMPFNISDTFVVLRPRSEWTEPGAPKEDVRQRLEAVLEDIPGASYEFTQPIEMRFNELLAGVRSDLAVKLFGDDFEKLAPVAGRIEGLLGRIPGARDVRMEQISGAPVLEIDVDRGALGGFGLDVAAVHEAVAIAVGGRSAGQVFEGDRRFDVVVRLGERHREDLAALARLPIPVPSPGRERDAARARPGTWLQGIRTIPLDSVAALRVTEGPNQVSRENGKRRIVVQANVQGRDIGSFVREAQARIAAEVPLPPGTWLEWGGQFEQLQEAKQRLSLVVPICFALIFLLLFSSFGNAKDALLVFSAVPLALTGGVAALALRGIPFSISAAVGFIAVSGVAVLNGVVMLSFIRVLRAEGREAEDAIRTGAVTRLRPVLMTALVASLGFVPMAVATGTGAEVQRPLATVVIGGLVSSTLLTLFVLPVLYARFPGRVERVGESSEAV
ncbi:MAG: efflux RND transporter permease subunit [Myxococcota bacterium]